MADEDLGIRISVRDQVKASNALKKVKVDLDQLGHAAAESDRKARASSVGWGTLVKSFVGLNVIQAGVNILTTGVRDLVSTGVGLARTATEVDAVHRRYVATFAEVTPQVDAFIKTTRQRLGIPTKDLEDAASRFGVLGESAQLARKDLPGFSTDMVRAGEDIAAFYNVNPLQVFTALRSGLTGMTRPLRQYGIFVDQTMLKNKALELGYGHNARAQREAAIQSHSLTLAVARQQQALQKHGAGSLAYASATAAVEKAQNTMANSANNIKLDLTDGQKVLLRQKIILDQVGVATGMASKLVDTGAGQWRVFRGTLTEVRNTVALSLLPAATKILTFFNHGLRPTLEWANANVGGWAKTLTKEVDAGLRVVKTLFTLLSGSDPIRSAARYLDDLTGSNGKLYTAILYVVNMAQNLWTILTQTLIPAFRDISKATLPFLIAGLWIFGGMMDYAGSHAKEFKTILELVVGAYVLVKGAILLNKAIIIAENIQMGIALGLRLAYIWATRGYVAAAAEAAAADTANIATGGILSAIMSSRIVALGASAIAWLSDAAAGLLYVLMLGAVGIAETAVIVATWLLTAAVWALNVAWIVLTSPITLIILGVALLAAGIYYAYMHFKWFRNAVDTVADALRGAFFWALHNWPLLLAILAGPIGLAVWWIVKHFDSVKQAVSGVWQFIQSVWSFVWKLLTAPIPFGQIWEGLKAGFKAAINWIIDVWNSFVNLIPAIHVNVPGFHFNLDVGHALNIPHLHQGGTTTSGGMVNMKPGEELVYLPPAATVVPMSAGGMAPTVAAAAGVGDGRPIVVQFVVDKKVLMEQTFSAAGDKMARS